MGLLRTIPQALADSLDATTFTSIVTQPTVARKNWVQIGVEDMADPVIYVTPAAATVTRVNRANSQIDYEATVFLGRHVQTESEADAMLDLADELVEAIKAHSWPVGVTWPSDVSFWSLTVEFNPDDALNDRNVWRAVITATYRTFSQDT